VYNVSVELGRFLKLTDVAAKARVAVLESQTAQDLFAGLNPTGERVRIRREPV
jgi:hypothetical protein